MDKSHPLYERFFQVKFPVLDDGFVCLVDVMGNDAAICQAARVSYGEGTKTVSDDAGLIRYLMRMRHSTPFEMCELKFLVRVPMDTWRQWIRHRTANVNEYSTRYSEAIDSAQKTDSVTWRLQSNVNKQGSVGFVSDWPEGYEPVLMDGSYAVSGEKDADWSVRKDGLPTYGFKGHPTPGDFLSRAEQELQEYSRVVYEERLKFGVAREQARKDLPLSTYTMAYWKIDLHNLLHFLGLRMDVHAQLEIRSYANVIGMMVEALFPLTWKAFRRYRLNAMLLSEVDVEALREYIHSLYDECSVKSIMNFADEHFAGKEHRREREEFLAKMKRLVSLIEFEAS